MKKVLFFIAAFTITAASVNAQDKVTHAGGTKFSVAVNAGFPTAADFKFAYGADAQVDIPAGTSLRITGSIGYENFHWKVSGGTSSFDGNVSQIPILAGVKYFLSSNFYGHGQIGYAVKGSSGNTLMPNDNGFAFAISGGYVMGNLDIGIKYLATHPGGSDLGAVIARLAYTLGSK